MIVFDTSLRFAGGIVSEALRAHPAALELLISNPSAVKALALTQNDKDKFAACLNLVLRDSEKDVLERMRGFGLSAPQNLWLRRILALKFGAVAFYVGSCLGAAERKHPGILDRFMNSEVVLHWGGNGSKLLSWLDGGRFGQGSPAADFLNRLLYAAVKEQRENAKYAYFAQRHSPGQKEEAAGGMVVMPDEDPSQARSRMGHTSDEPDDDSDSSAAIRYVGGETIELSDGPRTHLDEISEANLFGKDKTAFVSTSLQRIIRFVELTNRIGVSCGLMNEAGRVVINEKTQRWLEAELRSIHTDQQKRPAGKRETQPIFILEARLLIELVASGVL